MPMPMTIPMKSDVLINDTCTQMKLNVTIARSENYSDAINITDL